MSAAITLAQLSAGIKAAAPNASLSVWAQPIMDALVKCEATTIFRASAFIGQCVGEAGDGFSDIGENMYYTTAQRLVDVFPNEIPNVQIAAGYLRSPERLANRVYANRMGNGNEASGDGWKFRGGGLGQMTGRSEYAPYAAERLLSLDEAAAYVRTPVGAADSFAWYWTTHNLNAFADGWQISNITRAVNGAKMLRNAERIAAANACKNAMTAAT